MKNNRYEGAIAFLAATALTLGTTVAIADDGPGSIGDAGVNAATTVDLGGIDDATGLEQVDNLLGDAEVPQVAVGLIGASVDVDVLADAAADTTFLLPDGDQVTSAEIPELDEESGQVTLSTDDGSGEFSLMPAASGQTSETGAVAVTDLVGQDVAVVSQVTDNLEAQLIAVVNDETVNYVDYAVEIPAGFELQPYFGGFILLNESGDLGGWIEPAWAIDAAENPLPTSYEVLPNGIIRQHIDTTNAAFPIVADPKAKAKSSSRCAKVTGLVGVAHSALWGAAVGGLAGAGVAAGYGLFWWGVSNYGCR